ncbi:response regulator [Flavobacterium sp. ASW18X]|uniref:response regulator n=1 Tax=Flavobacterium sp. ASW18X TaxID=2572595 RepID=UPI0010AE962A|nr:response regulator [Flavobacterium sp. ASW18X]TKD59052.1 response regulator [Flavobacterium sp. ASW18X]
MENNKVFIIDDDMITVFGLKKILGKFQLAIEIDDFGNGADALAAIKLIIEQNKSIPNLIFLDINMPIMDGWTFLEEFIALPIDKLINIKIITSSIDKADRDKWHYFSENTKHRIDFLTKPIYKLDINDLSVLNMAS